MIENSKGKMVNPAIVEHMAMENEKLRGLLREALHAHRNPNRAQFPYDRITAALSQQGEPDHDCNYRTGGVICKVCDLNVIKQAEDTDTFTAVDMATAAAQEFRDGQAAVEPALAQDEREAFVAWATRLYNTGYLAGHHDTVEAGYTHVYQQDMDSYREEVVEEWLTDNPQPASLTRPAQTEQHPSTTQQILDLILEQCRYWHGRDEARRGGFACLYAQAKEIADNAAATAQTEHRPAAMVDANDDGMWADILPDVTVKVGQMLYAAPIAQTAPQPEQSGLVEALRLCIASLDQLLPYLAKVPADIGLLNEALMASRAALSAQGESHE